MHACIMMIHAYIHTHVCMCVCMYICVYVLCAMWKIGNYFGSDKLSLSRTFLYGLACIIKCLPYCSHFACNFLQPTFKREMVLKAAEVL